MTLLNTTNFIIISNYDSVGNSHCVYSSWKALLQFAFGITVTVANLKMILIVCYMV